MPRTAALPRAIWQSGKRANQKAICTTDVGAQFQLRASNPPQTFRTRWTTGLRKFNAWHVTPWTYGALVRRAAEAARLRFGRTNVHLRLARLPDCPIASLPGAAGG